MTACRRTTLGSELGSAAVEQRVTEIALLMRKAFPEYRWERARRGDGRHRLLVHFGKREIPVDFTYRELLTYSRLKRRRALDRRMYEALKKLF